MNLIENEILELNINMGIDKYLSEYEKLQKRLNLEEKNIKSLEKKFLSIENKKDIYKKDLSIEDINSLFENLLSSIDNDTDINKMLEIYKKANSLKLLVNKKLLEIKNNDTINLVNIN